jgi:hypothetical protein
MLASANSVALATRCGTCVRTPAALQQLATFVHFLLRFHASQRLSTSRRRWSPVASSYFLPTTPSITTLQSVLATYSTTDLEVAFVCRLFHCLRSYSQLHKHPLERR